MVPGRPVALALAGLLSLFALACGDGADLPAPTANAATAGTPAVTATAPEGVSSATPAPTQTGVAPDERVASTYSIPTDDLPVVRFTRAGGGTVDLPVEVPPSSEYSVGLSGRYDLEGRGMVFYYPGETGGPGFWMRNTHIDLDIAFVDGSGEIIAIRQMQAESEEIHHPGRAYLAGIEAPAGWYAEHGLAEGDTAEFLFEPEDYLE